MSALLYGVRSLYPNKYEYNLDPELQCIQRVIQLTRYMKILTY